MANWTLKVGFPVITVDENADGTVKLTQNRFLSTGDVKPEEDETIWWVPLEVKTIEGGKATVDHKAVLSERSVTYDLKGADTFKINADTIGVYRVKYSPERLAKLGKQASSFTTEDRVGLVSDATTLARAGYAKTSGSLNLVNELAATETEFLPLAQIGGALGKISTTWWEQPEEIRKAVAKLRVKVFRPIVDRLGYEHGADDAPDVKELRELAISTCALADDAQVLAELKKRFQPFLENNDDSQMPPDLQRSIFASAVRNGGEAEYNKIRAVYDKSPTPSAKVDAMYALCAAKDSKLLDRTFAMLSDGSIKDQGEWMRVGCVGCANISQTCISSSTASAATASRAAAVPTTLWRTLPPSTSASQPRLVFRTLSRARSRRSPRRRTSPWSRTFSRTRVSTMGCVDLFTVAIVDCLSSTWTCTSP
jgi:aminopeptidase 2